MTPELGTIEGFYGLPWDWDAKAAHVAALAPQGYSFYLYAPKADAFLRRRWTELHPMDEAERLAALAGHCRAHGVRFGIGLSPYELYLNFDTAARETLIRKLENLDAIGINDLAILFDDMRGDLPQLAEKQIEIVDCVAAHTKADRLIVCPSYYSDDPVLDRVFGERPAGYLEELGTTLDPAIDIFWTGPRVCSKEMSVEHLERVTETLRRKPFIWDNYPVNDGQRMSPFLHLRGFTGRAAATGAHVAAHGVNPASQPMLSRIPMLTLTALYRDGASYDAETAFDAAANEVAGAPLARMIGDDLTLFQDKGIDALTETETAALRNRYAAVDHPCAREIVLWLDGHWRITNEIVETQ
ncbi:Hyaluronidase [Parvibaculum lavamentivorans DS-1]|uniref:Hyaluronidase n=1 Tax=Parvibaculum lavamentivorans (strain DS-1 / DSM 13023 / NCIMB 13966) TaxID=402881 RepID=A7HTN5_PARL1|nr:beta-N-acetylglucosaminidase domain-containing protein [Parvibaculum lavamentivorans]ABS63268.1 Hyaluronidase [Parvibaculum lavamentivorans DS-1]